MTRDGTRIRLEHRGDESDIRFVNEAAFGRSAEADLVEQLRRDDDAVASFVAESHEQIVGHILFSRVVIEAKEGSVSSVALAPAAVLASHQRQGIGSGLIRFGLEALRERGEKSVLVLGHPEYYGRFGFSLAAARSLVTPFPPQAFMALALVPGALDGTGGVVRYPRAFGL